MRVNLILAFWEVLKWVWSSLNRNRLLFIQLQTQPLSMHHKWKTIRIYMQNNQWKTKGDQLLTKSSIELKDDYIIQHLSACLFQLFFDRIIREMFAMRLAQGSLSSNKFLCGKMNTWVQRKTPVRFRSMTSCHCCFFILISSVSLVIPEAQQLDDYAVKL